MGTLVIDDVDELLLADLARFAASNDISIKDQIKASLRQSTPILDRSKRAEIAGRIAAMTPKGTVQPDTVALLREDRDR